MNTVIKKRVENAMNYMVENFYEDLDLDTIAQASRLDKWYMIRMFEKRFGMTPFRWLALFRLCVAREYIAMMPDVTMTHVAFSCGFRSLENFSRCFKTFVGVSPSEYQRGLKGTYQKKVFKYYTDQYDDKNNIILRTAFEKVMRLNIDKKKSKIG